MGQRRQAQTIGSISVSTALSGVWQLHAHNLMRQKISAFSLVEVTLALGIIAFALISILALVPVGMKSSGEAIDATHTALIGQDIQKRVKSTAISTTFSANNDVNSIWFYDRDGFFLGTA